MNKIKVLLIIGSAFFYTKTSAQIMDSIQVDSFANSVTPSQEKSAAYLPGWERIIHTIDAHNRPKLTAYVSRTTIGFEFYTYDAVGNIKESITGTCHLKQDNHWYFICPPNEKLAWQKSFRTMRGK